MVRIPEPIAMNSLSAGWSKLDFAEGDKFKPVFLHWLESGKTSYVPLWDRIEGALLPPLSVSYHN